MIIRLAPRGRHRRWSVRRRQWEERTVRMPRVPVMPVMSNGWDTTMDLYSVPDGWSGFDAFALDDDGPPPPAVDPWEGAPLGPVIHPAGNGLARLTPLVPV